jgi:CopG family nickel-responsive transcriptional regulator
MQRVTISIDEELLEHLDRLCTRRGYASRSEALRDILRDSANDEQAEAEDAPCLGVLSYVFDFATRDLAQRLARMQAEHHDMVASVARLPLDHATSLEILSLRGPSRALRAFADTVTTQRGVRHARLHVVPVTVSGARHRHEHGAAAHEHLSA